MSYVYDSSYLDLEIYRLLTILVASDELAHYAAVGEESYWDDKRIDRLRKWEFPEVSRIVVSIAAIIRGGMQADPERYAGDWHESEGRRRHVGTLRPDLTQPDRAEPLFFSDALNKVIHAKRVVAEYGEYGGLTGSVCLHGDYRKKNWEASVNLRHYAMAATSVVPMEALGIEEGD
jgi:hypothetical protein